jgi:hypothetical protein
VISRCFGTCQEYESCEARGSSRPAKFGAMPPVTMSATPPRARSA